MQEQQFNPRAQAENQGADPSILANTAYPCGQIACRPGQDGCPFPDTSPDSAVQAFMCGQNMAIVAMKKQIGAQSDLLKNQDEISRDGVTETLIPQAFTKLIEELDNDGIIETVNNEGWSLQVSLFDLDKLGQHNDLGGQAGGDTALKSITDVLKQSFRRNGGAEDQDLPVGSPLPTISEHRAQINQAVRNGKMHDVITRLGGDEFLVISFMPKDQNKNRGKNPDLTTEKKRLETAFANTRAIYTPIREAVSDKKINKDGIVIDSVTLVDGNVSSGASTTFCITRIEDVSPAKINKIILELNETIESHKAGRKGLISTGLIHGDFLKS